MSIDQWINALASLVAFGACAVFAVTYHLRVWWWRSEMGRNLMALAAALGALFLYTVLLSVWPDGCIAVVLRGVRIVIALAIAGVMVQRTRLLIQTQREHRNRTEV
jgi:hypothetical protein